MHDTRSKTTDTWPVVGLLLAWFSMMTAIRMVSIIVFGGGKLSCVGNGKKLLAGHRVVGVTSTGFTARKIFVDGGEELTMLADWSSSGGCGWRGGILGRRPQLFPTGPITTKPLCGVMVWIHEPISSPSAAQAITSDCAKRHGSFGSIPTRTQVITFFPFGFFSFPFPFLLFSFFFPVPTLARELLT